MDKNAFHYAQTNDPRALTENEKSNDHETLSADSEIRRSLLIESSDIEGKANELDFSGQVANVPKPSELGISAPAN